MNFSVDILKSIDSKYQSTSFDYDKNNSIDKINFTPEPKPFVKTKTLVSPQLEFNDSFNNIHKLISDGNLQSQIREGYENINYVPITSSGYRGYSALNSRPQGIKLPFNSPEITKLPFIKQEKPTSPKAQKVPEILKIRTSPTSPYFSDVEQQFPAFNTSAKPGDSSPDSIRRSPITKNVLDSPKKASDEDSIGNAIWDAMMNDRQEKASSSKGGLSRAVSSSSSSGDSIGDAIFDSIKGQSASQNLREDQVKKGLVFKPLKKNRKR